MMNKLRMILLLIRRTNLNIFPLVISVTVSSVLGGLLVYTFAPFVSIVLLGNQVDGYSQLDSLLELFSSVLPNLTIPYMLGWSLCLVALLNGIFQYLRLNLFNEFCQGVVERLSNIFFTGYLKRDYLKIKFTDQKKLENLILIETYQIMNYFVRPLVEMTSAFVAITAILLAMILVDYRIMYLFISLSIALIATYTLVRNKFQLLGTRRQASQEEKHLVLNESFQSFKDIRFYGQTEMFSSRFASITSSIKSSEVFANVSAELPKLVLEALVPIGVAIFGLISFANLEYDDGFALTSIAVLGVALVKMLPDVSKAYRSISLIKFSGPICDLIETQLSLVPEVKNKKNQDFDAVTLDNNIILKSVEFSYDGGKSIFKPINSTINKGDKVAVIGPSGVGKSTLLDLISGLIKPTNGTIEIDSTDLSEIDQESWLQNFAYVPQEVLLMDTDINENISFKKELSDGELKTISSLIKELNLEKLVKDRHLFKVGNRGQNLSGGQRQRIAIARALFFKRDIIIMDEPTSALDGDNSQKILNLVFREFESKTIFVITHDSKLLQNFDKVIELNR